MLSRGTSLVEAVIYLAIFSVVLTSTLATTYQLLRSDEELTERQLVTEEADFISQKINWLLSGATNINIRGPDTLEISKQGQTYTLTLESAVQSLTLNNLRLNSQRVKISQVSFSLSPTNQLLVELKINQRSYHLDYPAPT